MYNELKTLANRQLDNNTQSPTLGPTVLVHELYLKLSHHSLGSLPRDQFMHLASVAMKRLIIDHLRRRHALSRGGGRRRVGLESLDLRQRGVSFTADQVEYLDDLLTQISEQSSEADQAVRVFQLQFYLGLTLDQCAAALDISKATALRRAHFARAALRRRLAEDKGNFDGIETKGNS